MPPIDFGVDSFTPAVFDVPADFDVGLETLDWHETSFDMFGSGSAFGTSFSETERFFGDNFMDTLGMANAEIGGGAGDSWWDFAQEKLSQGVNDFGSAAMTGLQGVAVETAKGLPQTAGDFFSGWLQQGTRKLMQTTTGQQIEQAAIQGKITEIMTNPWVLFAGAIGIVVLMVTLIKR